MGVLGKANTDTRGGRWIRSLSHTDRGRGQIRGVRGLHLSGLRNNKKWGSRERLVCPFIKVGHEGSLFVLKGEQWQGSKEITSNHAPKCSREDKRGATKHSFCSFPCLVWAPTSPPSSCSGLFTFEEPLCLSRKWHNMPENPQLLELAALGLRVCPATSSLSN